MVCAAEGEHAVTHEQYPAEPSSGSHKKTKTACNKTTFHTVRAHS